MIWALALAVAIWIIGGRIGWPRQARVLALGLFYVVVLALSILLPAGSPLGGDVGEWLVLGGLGVLVWAYAEGLKLLRRRVRPENRPPEPRADTFAPGEVERYARHIVLRELGGPGQKRLKTARVLVVGAGGLGSPAMLYLAAAGVGTIGVIDDDTVEATNLQRQVIHSDARIGMAKVFSAEAAMKALNPFVNVRPYHRRLTAEIAGELVAEYDLVLDGCDDLDTRYVLNAACTKAQVPLVSGALSQWEGQLTTYAPWAGTPCYACIFPEKPAPGLASTCAEAGVLGPLPGILGTMMAAEAVKELTGAGQGHRGRMAIHDALWGENRTITLARRPDCPVCGGA
ncbi:Molybdopterin or thiamine biosynthesis adenylyltransferase [Palleronia marisminoris]|uniref:Molybdopterin-synthase adenylyltransferase n=1 Tax=Palleronia marisminoris TaxID=315423 RepID=A0A1Y5SC94_9RHOB|nr:HesA/MoeB/ThiF family protein [Palleronia marisminoris]SFG70352.1 Molybdopterin or thiamine biosynthesis adenylyltransferase [Palleronia marisminoris]SLN35912.1 Molybdopterin-synthase adenylyltransferase [Palleronia marisminoris]